MKGIEIKYTINIIMDIAFPHFKFKYISDNHIYFENIDIIFNIMNNEDYKKLIAGTLKMKKISNFDNTFKIPVFNEKDKFYIKNKNGILINADILTLPFLLLSRKEELEIPVFDKYGRFSFNESLSYKYDLIDYPIVDEYAMIFRNIIIDITKVIVSKNSNCFVYLTHDIDNLNRFGNFSQNLKTIIGGDLLSRKNFKLALKSFGELLKTRKDSTNDPKTKSIYDFINNEANINAFSKYFFLSYDKDYWDFRYDINDDRVKLIIENIAKQKNMDFGLHCGFNAYDNIEEFKKQYLKLRKYGNFSDNRNHYLRYDAMITPNVLEKNGIKSDYTLGYHERTGFKCGTCHEYKLYDFENSKVSSVTEYPLIIMDVTIKNEMKLNSDKAYKLILKYYNLCKRLNGNFIILWHPDNCIREWRQYYKDVYMKFILFLRNSDNK